MTEQTSPATSPPPSEIATDAAPAMLALHRRAILIDMHADTVQRVVDEGADINARLPDGHLDAVRAREGGLGAQFFSIWVEPEYFGAGGSTAVERADTQIAAVRALAEERPDIWQPAGNAEDIRRAAREGKIATLMGLEGGYAIDGKIEHVEKYFRLGVRYLSAAWTVSLPWAGSSGDEAGAARGLNEFGRRVVREMNRLGMMPDVSHVSDKTFWDIVETSEKPVIATHSGARSIVDHPRNLTDEQIIALAQTGGACCVVFYPAFVEPGWKEAQRKVDAEIGVALDEVARLAPGTPRQKKLARDRARAAEYARRMPQTSAARVVDHVDHVARLCGVDHVGVGSDFDGIQATPRDLASVADYPNLTKELLRRGYTEADVEKILGGNILRVMERTQGNQEQKRKSD